MRAIGVHQPWASLILNGGKDVENRFRPTNIRGDIVIHATKSTSCDYFTPAYLLAELGVRTSFDFDQLPRGALIGVVEIVGCKPAEQCSSPWADRGFGGFCWILANARPFASAVPWKGERGFFQVPDAVVAEALKQSPSTKPTGRAAGELFD